MIHVEIRFGRASANEKQSFEDLAEAYIASMFHSGQLCGESFIFWIEGELVCSTLMTALNAGNPRYHSNWAAESLEKVVSAFGRKPIWLLRDDDVPKRNVAWRAPSLYLFTHAFNWEPPVCRGDTSRPIATCLLPLSDRQKEDLYGWQQEYVLLDRLWLQSNVLEGLAYKDSRTPKASYQRKAADSVEKSRRRPAQRPTISSCASTPQTSNVMIGRVLAAVAHGALQKALGHRSISGLFGVIDADLHQ